MTQYVLNVIEPVMEPGFTPPPEFLEPVMRKVNAVSDEIKAAGEWVFAGGLNGPDATTVVRHQDGETLMTDGPYVEGKEHVGGFTIVDSPDLDAALAWAGKYAEATGLPIEVRPFRY
ncbi:YciI family protein [Aeromicrobium sp.]|uniref:YciI family protein n=1 Tax=Aeromicrobium sp. TaxID=1871063 RepID=UPI002FCA8D36